MNKKDVRILEAEIEKIQSDYESEQSLILAFIEYFNEGEDINNLSLIKLLMRIQDYMSKFDVLKLFSQNEVLEKRVSMENDYLTIFSIVEQQIKKECCPSKVQHSKK